MPETSITTKVIAEAIRRRLDQAQISQTKLGKLIGKSQSYVSTRCKGEQAWTTDDIDKIAKALGLSNGFALIDDARGIAERK